jgi:hypothetical protein
MIWEVVTATNKVGPGDLAGDYAGRKDRSRSAQGSAALF